MTSNYIDSKGLSVHDVISDLRDLLDSDHELEARALDWLEQQEETSEVQTSRRKDN